MNLSYAKRFSGGAAGAAPRRGLIADRRTQESWQTTAVRQRVSLITLGVRDLARARRFYEALGWSTGAAAEDDVVFFQAGETVLALWDRAGLRRTAASRTAPAGAA